MRIPNCREDDCYNQKYLNEEDGHYIIGFDNCVSDCIKNFFHNADIYEQIFNDFGINKDNGYDFREIDSVVLEDNRSIEEYSTKELAQMSKITKLLKVFSTCMQHYAENERDETITSFLDGYSVHEFDEIKKKVDKTGYQNALMKHIERERQFKSGELPTCWEYKKDTESGRTVAIGHSPNGNDVVRVLGFGTPEKREEWSKNEMRKALRQFADEED